MVYKSLLESYQGVRNFFYFSTPEYEILAQKSFDEISFNHATDLPQIIADIKRKGKLKNKLVVGTIPFDVEESGTLYITDNWEKQEIPFKKREKILETRNECNPIIKKKYIPSPQQYMEMAKQGITAIKKGELDKLVLSRGIEAEFENKINILPVLVRAYQSNPLGFTYALDFGEGRTLIGASPEMLISKRGNYIYSNPLAGSRPRGNSKEEDTSFANELLNSQKDLSEHKFVVDNIVDKVCSVCRMIKISKTPHLIQTNRLWHLSSIIEGELNDSEKTVFDAALLIHPTPAVCGVPQDVAYKKIIELEGKSRNEFTGIIGWCDEFGNGDWAIAIRGAKIDNNRITIQAGAGIVKNSVPVEEMKETGIKCETMLSAFGLTFD